MKRILAVGLAILLLLGCLAGCQSTPDTLLGENLNRPADLSNYKSKYGSPEQDALISTALAYLARGSRIQYDDSNFSPSQPIHRWQVEKKTGRIHLSVYRILKLCRLYL